jgi:uncharacterized BrkB/YihY/UPF0761 family membrane protein
MQESRTARGALFAVGLVTLLFSASGALTELDALAVSIALLSTVFAAAFHLVPRSHPPLRDVLGGAVLTTVLPTILKAVFASYLSNLTNYSAYGRTHRCRRGGP